MNLSFARVEDSLGTNTLKISILFGKWFLRYAALLFGSNRMKKAADRY
jgi:hypothetical protein